ncbi:MAG: hypothetical protein HZB99_03370 [Candidatus Harrisonbacteria bacterium]|nr:hypothetical protein [Candidatus Harrisonbacteria bacterium]
MHLKKIWRIILLLPILTLASCDEEQVDTVLVQDTWKKILKLTDLPPNTPLPEIVFLKEDFYYQLLMRDCEQYENGKKTRCEKNRQVIESRASAVLGQPANNLYQDYLRSEYRILREDCSRYQNKKDRKQCKSDKNRIIDSAQGILGRAFLNQNRAEIYVEEIAETLYHWENYYRRINNDISYEESGVYFYGTVAHEMLHLAFSRRGIPTNQHHKLMKVSGMLEKLTDFLSTRLGAFKNGPQKDLKIKGLGIAIENDEVYDRTIKRISEIKEGGETN